MSPTLSAPATRFAAAFVHGIVSMAASKRSPPSPIGWAPAWPARTAPSPIGPADEESGAARRVRRSPSPAGRSATCSALLDGPLKGAFGGVHVLPFFHPIDGADAGFDPIDHTQVDPRLGTWDDVAALAARTEVHGRRDRQPRVPPVAAVPGLRPRGVRTRRPPGCFSPTPACSRMARASRTCSRFTRRARVFPSPDTRRRMATTLLLWTTFTSEQIDIDVRASGRPAVPRRRPRAAPCRRHPGDPPRRGRLRGQEGRHELLHDSRDVRLHRRLHGAGARARHRGAGRSPRPLPGPDRRGAPGGLGLRLRAAAARAAHAVHARRDAPEAMARDSPAQRRHRAGHARRDRRGGRGCRRTAAGRRRAAPPEDIEALVETIHRRSRGESRLASGVAARTSTRARSTARSTTRSAAATAEYLVARAIQCFVPGIPQIYYVGLLAGGNDMDLLRRTGVGRDINRHYYTPTNCSAT